MSTLYIYEVAGYGYSQSIGVDNTKTNIYLLFGLSHSFFLSYFRFVHRPVFLII